MGKLSVRAALRGKNILLTGATGFIGKVWLCLALTKIPELGKICVLLRPKGNLSAKQRLEIIINTSPVFSLLHETYGEGLQSMLGERLQVIEGDLGQPCFGMDEDLIQDLAGEIDLILNCAGNVNFAPDLRDAFSVNVEGALHAAQLARTLGAALLHVSTAYVCGERDGKIDEALIPDYCPMGEGFDAEREYEEIIRVLGGNHEKIDAELGKKMANRWGWPNAYAYTKSLAESLLLRQAGAVPMSFFRPTIVESSLRFPFPGWNEGITTCAPLSYLASNWIRVFPLNPRYLLDIIPVDIVCEAMTVAAAALMEGEAKPVYQCGS